MPTIRLLSDRLIGKIAAGEVVERPASVLKELIENSLDAGAGSVVVELEVGGKRRIRVVDDGRGMDGDDALLAFDRHATSKIASFEDLERVSTLGFRGEALASIAAVSRVELTTASEPGDGYRVRIEGGRIRGREPAARARGTTVEVSSLFFNVPARRKFLKSPRTELRRALEVAQGYALARPEVRFQVWHEQRTLLDAPPAGEGERGARRRVEQIFGGELAAALAPLPRYGGGIWGFVGDPTTARGRRYFVFVNRRLIRDRAVMSTFYRAVREEWRSEDFPAFFLFLDLPPQEVDVNVHPQKAEVRFRDSRFLGRLFERLRVGLRASLGEVPAPVEAARQLPGVPVAWSGLGSRRGWPATGAAEVREGEAAPARLAEAVYAPLKRPPVLLSGRQAEPRGFRLLGQYKGTLIVLEGPDGLYLIDQHVAHERLLYERLRRELEREQVASQSLLDPILLELAPAERVRLSELADELEGCGFSVRELSGDSAGLASVPAALPLDRAEALLRALLATAEGEGEEAGDLRARILDALAASLACRAAVKMHEPLAADEMERLVQELFAAEQPFACPHGRPIVLRLTDRDLERRFGRS